MKLKVADRLDLIAMLQEHRARGTFSTALVARTAERVDVTERYIWKLLADPPEPQLKPRAWNLTDEAIDLYYDHFGNVTAVLKSMQEGGLRAPVNVRQLQRCFHRQLSPEERWFAKKGFRARREHSGCLRWEAPHRNAIVQMDLTWLKVRVHLPGSGAPKGVKVGVLRMIDCYSRAIKGWMVVPTESSDAALEAMYDSFIIDDDHEFGGIPWLVIYDNGMAYLAQVIEFCSGRLGFDTLAIDAYSPGQNGKSERSHQTLAHGVLPQMPGWAGGRRDRANKIIDSDQLVHFDVLVEELAAGVRKYNYEHKHSALRGCTPAHAWRDDDTPLRTVEPEKLRFAVRHQLRQTVQTSGVYKHGKYYRSDVTDRMVGDEVIVTWLLKDKRFIDVYSLDGTFLTRCERNTGHSAEQRVHAKRERSKRWAEQDKRARASAKRKREKFAATNAPGGYADLADDPNENEGELDTYQPQTPPDWMGPDDDSDLNKPWKLAS